MWLAAAGSGKIQPREGIFKIQEAQDGASQNQTRQFSTIYGPLKFNMPAARIRVEAHAPLDWQT